MSPTRRTLLRSSLLAAPLLASELLPALARADRPSTDSIPKADPNQWFWFPGHSFCMKATGKDTGGTAGWMLAENAPHQGVPFHKHLYEDESFLVLDGLFEISVGDTTITGGPGTFAFGPRGIPHRWTNVGTSRGRIMNTFTPSGFEGMFYEVGVPIPDSAAHPPVDPGPLVARMPALAAKYGNTRTGDFKFPPPPGKPSDANLVKPSNR